MIIAHEVSDTKDLIAISRKRDNNTLIYMKIDIQG